LNAERTLACARPLMVAAACMTFCSALLLTARRLASSGASGCRRVLDIDSRTGSYSARAGDEKYLKMDLGLRREEDDECDGGRST